ncbi:MAG TPA: hypothetical protein VMV92_10885 [Streptosporangiaceae bacterium]|nr:hypothetical protein [Streptosporangiaceae bacterium]
MHGPDVLFLGEPTGALDPQARRNLWDLLRDISAETTTRPAPVLAALAGRGALAGLEVKGATLEDVFLQLTGREYRA